MHFPSPFYVSISPFYLTLLVTLLFPSISFPLLSLSSPSPSALPPHASNPRLFQHRVTSSGACPLPVWRARYGIAAVTTCDQWPDRRADGTARDVPSFSVGRRRQRALLVLHPLRFHLVIPSSLSLPRVMVMERSSRGDGGWWSALLMAMEGDGCAWQRRSGWSVNRATT